MTEELRDHPRAAFFRRVYAVESGADPVERPEQRVLQSLLHAIGVDDAIHQLFGAGIDPARFVDRAEHHVGHFRIELAVFAHAIDLGGRGEDHAFAVFHALTHDRQVGLEIEFKHAQRFFDIGRRRGDRHQRQHRVAFAHVIFDPFLVDRDVAFKKMKARMVEQIRDALGLHVHAIDLPIGGLDDAL